MAFKKDRQPYITVMSIILAVTVMLFSVRIFSLQVIDKDNLAANSSGLTEVKVVLPAPRGEILDRDGRQIAVNRDGYDIVFNNAHIERATLNELILELITLCEEYNTEYIDKLPLLKTAPYGFEDDFGAIKLRKFLNVADYTSAEQCFKHLAERYSLGSFTVEQQRKIMGVRYTMEKAAFSVSAPYTFAEDISHSLMLIISEMHMNFTGVSVEVTPYRHYPISNLMPHLIGTTGPIYEEEWEQYKEKGYNYNDRVGKSGIELYAEEHLRGTDGEMIYYFDSNGKMVNSVVTKEPIPGKTVMLTIDKSLQKVTQDVLASSIENLKKQNPFVSGGSVVVMGINSGTVLASANYPSYDMATMSKEYNNLLNDKNKPLLDRAFQGVYPIGSTVKPLVALAAMEKEQYEYGETIFCKKTYDYFTDFKPNCMHYHGTMSLKNALARSCNYFFFELGRRTGIKTLNEYYKNFGLGVKTGVEINDSKGILTEFESDSGNTIQVAIGQLNAFTPLQLASYTCTLANGGTRYKATLIDSVVSYNYSQTYLDNKPEVLGEYNIDSTMLSQVKEGMLSVTEDGTGSTVFGNYGIKVGGKTGTSQTDSGADHSVFIAFAPFDKPEIAISVVLEHGASTYTVTSIARAVLDSYFFAKGQAGENIPPYTVLQ